MKPTNGNGPDAGHIGAVKDQSTPANSTDDTAAWPALTSGSTWAREARHKAQLIELINAMTATDDTGECVVRWYELGGAMKGRVAAIVQLGRDTERRQLACVVVFTDYRPTLQIDAVQLREAADRLWQGTTKVREAFEDLMDLQAKSPRRLTDKQCSSYDSAEYRWDRMQFALMQAIACPSNHGAGIPLDAEIEAFIYYADAVEVLL